MTMPEHIIEDGAHGDSQREAVGVFDNADALEAAVDELEISGFNRAAISVLANDETVKDRLGRLYRSVAEIEDDPRAPLAAFVSRDSRVGGEAAAVGVPMFIGGIAGGLAVVASGGALAAAFLAAVGVGAVGAGIGGLLARVISHRHVDQVSEQLVKGGLVLWVGVGDDAAAARALDVLIKAGARDAHVHEIQREWVWKNRTPTLAQPDPFLGNESVGP
jgi:hypothetical protein